MTNSDVEKQSLGDELLKRGWKQGALFSAPSLYFVYNNLSNPNSEFITAISQRNLKNKEKLIIISQDCDIKAATEVEPYVEALICKPQNPKFIERVSQLSARWFVIDPDTRLVAEAKYKLQIAKEVLLHLEPEPWLASANRLDAFVRWLGRRYDRPALPDEMVKVFQTPIESKIKDLKITNPTIFIAFNDAVHNIRVSLPISEEPPFDLHLIFLIKDDGLTEQEAEAIEIVKELILTCLDTKLVQLDPDIRTLVEEEISVAEYYASRPMYFDYYTYNGEEIEGSEPYGRT